MPNWPKQPRRRNRRRHLRKPRRRQRPLLQIKFRPVNSSTTLTPPGVQLRGELAPAFPEIVSPEALAFVAKLQRAFGNRREECLQRRQDRQVALDRGEALDFLPETKSIRESDWTCAPIPADLRDRRVEITGPTDRKMVINALNSGAKVFMADFEDANSPTWT